MANRIGQQAVEVLNTPDTAAATTRIGQQAVEAMIQPDGSIAFTNVGQIVVEVLISLDVAPSPAGGTGRWFFELWGEDAILGGV